MGCCTETLLSRLVCGAGVVRARVVLVFGLAALGGLAFAPEADAAPGQTGSATFTSVGEDGYARVAGASRIRAH
jgi:hypothetical protein